MTQQFAAVLASISSFTQLSATMSYVTAIIFRILEFFAKAEIMFRYLLRYILASWTPPTTTARGTICPFDNTRQMENMKAVAAVPRLVPSFNILTADEAF